MSESGTILNDAMKALAAEGAGGAPKHVEIALRRAFRARRRRRMLGWAGGLSIPAAVAAAVMLIALGPESAPVARPRAVTIPVLAPKMAWITPAAPPRLPARPVRRPQTARTAPVVARADTRAIEATPFFALPYGDDSLAAERQTVMRVELPRSAMRLVGLPVAEDRIQEPVQADVVFGGDGLARAVRFIE